LGGENGKVDDRRNKKSLLTEDIRGGALPIVLETQRGRMCVREGGVCLYWEGEILTTQRGRGLEGKRGLRKFRQIQTKRRRLQVKGNEVQLSEGGGSETGEIGNTNCDRQWKEEFSPNRERDGEGE